MSVKTRWVLFCKVIDNFGDAGVAWRLAQQLVNEHNLTIDLVIDRPELLTQFGIYNDSKRQDLRVLAWSDTAPPLVGDVTIACFACTVPQAYQNAMAHRFGSHQSGLHRYWFNLEYLSAEPWIDSHHLLGSTKPLSGLIEHFFFPGFTAASGGLIREKNYFSDSRQSCRNLFGVDEKSLAISLFCYSSAPVAELFQALTIHCEQSELHVTIDVFITATVDVSGFDSYPLIRFHRLPFLTQPQYDQILHACDLNFVRGEDSLVRAIWARQPFVWQAYPQDRVTQGNKVQALLDVCQLDEQNHPLCAHLNQLFNIWNFPADSPIPLNGQFSLTFNWLLQHRAEWRKQVEQSCDRLSQQPDLADQLVRASRKLMGFA